MRKPGTYRDRLWYTVDRAKKNRRGARRDGAATPQATGRSRTLVRLAARHRDYRGHHFEDEQQQHTRGRGGDDTGSARGQSSRLSSGRTDTSYTRSGRRRHSVEYY